MKTLIHELTGDLKHKGLTVAWLRHYAASQKVMGSIPAEIVFLSLCHPSIHTLSLGSTQPLIEMSAGNLHRGKGPPAHKADNLTSICELIV
jgi:hypothetical protein